MSRNLWFVLSLAVSSGALAMAPAHVAGNAACAVWQRELAFAQSVQQHDAAAFATFLASDTVFDANTDKPMHGATAVRQHWATFIDGKALRLSWYPQQVVVAGDGTLAYSSGAYLFENAAPGAQPRYTTGKFATVWRRAGDVWRVAFDGGDAGHPASEADVATFRAGRHPACPVVAATH